MHRTKLEQSDRRKCTVSEMFMRSWRYKKPLLRPKHFRMIILMPKLLEIERGLVNYVCEVQNNVMFCMKRISYELMKSTCAEKPGQRAQ
jgi:hypothetical protein